MGDKEVERSVVISWEKLTSAKKERKRFHVPGATFTPTFPRPNSRA